MPGYSHLHEDLCGVVEQVYQFLGEMSIVWERQGRAIANFQNSCESSKKR